MHSNNFNNPAHRPLSEGMQFKDLDSLMKPTIHVDEFSSKMGDDEDVIVLSFFVRDKQAARDLMSWFEKGYDFILDADRSPGEIKPNRYLVYVEMRRRPTAPEQIQQMLDDLSTLTEFEPSDWQIHYEDQTWPWSEKEFAALVPLSADDYRARHESDLNEWRTAAGLPERRIHEVRRDVAALQSAAGII